MGGGSPEPVVSRISEEDHYKVPIEMFQLGEKLEADVFFYHQRQYVIFKSRGQSWASEDLKKLSDSNIESLFIRFKSKKDHHEFLHRKLRFIISNPSVPTEKKARVLFETSEPILTTVYSSPNSSELIASAGNFVKACIQYLGDRGSLPELFQLSGESLTEHTHALHVSTYSVALGKKAGIRDQQQLYTLGLGALLHDIGKSKIDPTILNKAGELNDEEWLLMRQHPEMGEQILFHRDIVPVLSRKIVLEHHERVNGKGYPKGIKSIHQFSKIVGIADCFNSLTSQKPYAKAMPPYEALKYMIQFMKYEFDSKLLNMFIDMLSE